MDDLDHTDNTMITRADDHDRFEITVDGELAGYADFHLHGDRIEFTHTLIDDAFEGRGLGSLLVRAALEQSRADRLVVTPTCPFVRDYIDDHPEYADLLAS